MTETQVHYGMFVLAFTGVSIAAHLFITMFVRKHPLRPNILSRSRAYQFWYGACLTSFFGFGGLMGCLSLFESGRSPLYTLFFGIGLPVVFHFLTTREERIRRFNRSYFMRSDV